MLRYRSVDQLIQSFVKELVQYTAAMVPRPGLDQQDSGAPSSFLKSSMLLLFARSQALACLHILPVAIAFRFVPRRLLVFRRFGIKWDCYIVEELANQFGRENSSAIASELVNLALQWASLE